MGPSHPHRQPANAAGFFVALALLAGFGLLVVGALFLFGWSFFRVQTVAIPATPVPAMKTMASSGTTTIVTSGGFAVEIDQQGNVSLDGEEMPLEQVEARLQERLQAAPIDASLVEIRAEEGCPFEHVQAVRDMYARLGIEEPKLTTVPPRRDVTVELDAEGKPTLDGEPVADIGSAFQEIAQKHGRRATLTLHVDPQCPAEVVVQIEKLWTDSGLGEVKIAEDK
jgi:biopolymer transport protein ExbD